MYTCWWWWTSWWYLRGSTGVKPERIGSRNNASSSKGLAFVDNEEEDTNEIGKDGTGKEKQARNSRCFYYLSSVLSNLTVKTLRLSIYTDISCRTIDTYTTIVNIHISTSCTFFTKRPMQEFTGSKYYKKGLYGALLKTAAPAAIAAAKEAAKGGNKEGGTAPGMREIRMQGMGGKTESMFYAGN